MAPEDQTSAAWLALAIKANFQAHDPGRPIAAELRVGDETVSLYVEQDEIDVREEPARKPDPEGCQT